jgi:hypothetical protein
MRNAKKNKNEGSYQEQVPIVLLVVPPFGLVRYLKQVQERPLAFGTWNPKYEIQRVEKVLWN